MAHIKAKYFIVLVALIALAALWLGGCEKKEQRGVIVVSGIGTVSAQPDTVQMNISLSRTAPTTSRAQSEVNIMVRQALDILQKAGIEEKNISTASLRFFPEYEWGGSRRVLLGQRAEQGISFSVNSANNNQVSDIIDQLIQINGIELQQMQFSIKDSAELYVRSRELAYQKALEKAEQYARLSGQKIVRAISISEDGNMASPVVNMARNRVMADALAAEPTSGTSLPSGEMDVSSRIVVEFLLK